MKDSNNYAQRHIPRLIISLVVAVLLLFTAVINNIGQTAVLKASHVEISYTDDWDDATLSTIDDGVIKIVWNIDDNVIHIYTEEQQKFVLAYLEHTEKRYESFYSSDITHDIYRGYDKNGISCYITVSFDKDTYFIGESDWRIGIIYDSFRYRYFCKVL